MTFTVAATAVPSATYEWKKDGLTLSDGGKISGAQTASLTITGVTSDDVGTYSCTATNVCGSDTKSATLAVYDETKITTQPLTQTVCPGSNHPVTFTAAATGSGALSYQWQKNGGDINNATLSSYSIASPAEGDEGSYTVIVRSANCTSDGIASSAAVLTVNAVTQIDTQPLPLTVCPSM